MAVLQLAGVLTTSTPPWHMPFQGLLDLVQFAIGLAMLAGQQPLRRLGNLVNGPARACLAWSMPGAWTSGQHGARAVLPGQPSPTIYLEAAQCQQLRLEELFPNTEEVAGRLDGRRGRRQACKMLAIPP